MVLVAGIEVHRLLRAVDRPRSGVRRSQALLCVLSHGYYCFQVTGWVNVRSVTGNFVSPVPPAREVR